MAKVLNMMVEGQENPKVEILTCCPNQKGILARINMEDFLVITEVGDTKKMQDGTKKKGLDFFSFKLTQCLGCGKTLSSIMKGEEYIFGDDDGLAEHFRILANAAAERREKMEKKN